MTTIQPFSRGIAAFSDDGVRFDGAYGPKVVDQLRYVIDSFRKDIYTRQAIIDIWRPNPRDSSDIPCTLSLQFLIRDGHLNTIATMRSSDIWLGWPYDVFNFTMITSYIALELMKDLGIVPLGYLYVRPGSLHLYESNWEEVQEILNDGWLDCVHRKWDPYVYDHVNTMISDLEFAKHNKDGSWGLRGIV